MGHWYDDGNVGYYLNVSDSIFHISKNAIQELIYQNNFSEILIKEYKRRYDFTYEYPSPPGNGKILTESGTSGSAFTYYNNNSHKNIRLGSYTSDYRNKNTNGYGFIPDYFRFSNDSNFFITIINPNVSTCFFNKDTAYRLKNVNIPVNFSNIILSPKNKFYILATNSHSICFVDVNSNRKINEIFLKDGLDADKIALTQDGKGFLATNSVGSVKYFRPDFFTDSLRAFFNSDLQLESVNKPITFYSYSTGSPTDYQWDFGDGTSSNEINPVHIYKNAGNYSIRLIVTDGKTKDTLVKFNYIVIQAYMKSDFEADITLGLPPLTIKFINKSVGNIVSYQWDFGDSTFSQSANPTHEYQISGIYPVRLIISDGVLYDTLIKKDFITVQQLLITDSFFDKEISLMSYDKDMVGLSGFQTSDDGFFIESTTLDKNLFFRLNSNFDTLWTTSFYKNSFNIPMKKGADDLFFFMGDTIPSFKASSIQSIDALGNFRKCFSFLNTMVVSCFDYMADSAGIISFSEGKDYMSNNLNIFSYNLDGKLIFSTNTNSMVTNDFVFSAKFDNSYKNVKSMLINSHIDYNNYNFKSLLNVDSVVRYGFNYRPLKICNVNFPSNITDFKHINENCFVYIENMNNLYYFDHDTLLDWSDRFSNVTIKSLLVVSDSIFVMSGSKEGYCWFALMNIQGKVLSEHWLKNRKGTLNFVSLNNDNSLLFIGSLYKNSFHGKASSKTDERVLGSLENNASYILKSKYYKILSTETTKIQTDEVLTLYPNPATDFLDISYSPSINRMVNHTVDGIAIYNVFGEKIPPRLTSSATPQEGNLRFDVSGLPPGVYFVRVGEKVGKFIKIEN